MTWRLICQRARADPERLAIHQIGDSGLDEKESAPVGGLPRGRFAAAVLLQLLFGAACQALQDRVLQRCLPAVTTG